MKTPRVLWMLMAAVLTGILMLPVHQRALAQDQPPAAAATGPGPGASQIKRLPRRTKPCPSPTRPQPEASPAQDPPSRVARLSYSNGSVSFQPGGQGDWVTAVQNRPLSNGDNLWADKDSRAEFQMGSTSVRMDSETSVTFLELDDHTTQLRLSQGSLVFRVRHLDDEDRFEIDTPNSAFQVQRPGEYRVDVNCRRQRNRRHGMEGTRRSDRRRRFLRGGRRPAGHLHRHRHNWTTRSGKFPVTMTSTILLWIATNAKTRPIRRITFLRK